MCVRKVSCSSASYLIQILLYTSTRSILLQYFRSATSSMSSLILGRGVWLESKALFRSLVSTMRQVLVWSSLLACMNRTSTLVSYSAWWIQLETSSSVSYLVSSAKDLEGEGHYFGNHIEPSFRQIWWLIVRRGGNLLGAVVRKNCVNSI